MESLQLSRKDELLKKLADTEAENAVSLIETTNSFCLSNLTKYIRFCFLFCVRNNMFSFLLQHLVVKLQEKDREVNRLAKLLDNEKVAVLFRTLFI